MWVEAPRKLPNELQDKITEAIGHREDREDTVWLNLDTGARVVLAANGGWRTAADSAFKALFISPSGELTDVSYGLLGGPVPFDAAAERGAASYTGRMSASVAHIESVLGVDVRRLNYGQITPVRTL